MHSTSNTWVTSPEENLGRRVWALRRLAVGSLGILHVLTCALLIGGADSMQHHFFLRINLRLSFFVELYRPKVASRLLGIAISEPVMQTTTAPSPKTW
jgi:hypothetical protein